jgi:hypothetical protein
MRSKAKVASRREHWQSHLQRARTLKMSLAEYCRRRGLKVQNLYNARHELSGKQRRGGARQKQAACMSRFVAVELAVPSSATPGSGCRIQLRDVVIECAQLPEAVWLAALARGAADAVS